MVEWDASFVVLISGVDVMFGDTVHVDKRWTVEDVRFGGQWVNIVKEVNDTRIFNYKHFHDIEGSEQILEY